MPRILAIGDLNGDDDALARLLEAAQVIDRSGRWCGKRTHVVQVGDIFNRGPRARHAFLRLSRLGRAARADGGDVTVLLGNHEVMTALGNEAYCTVDEYLAFASPAARRAWQQRVQRTMMRLYRERSPGGAILPLQPRLDAWAVTRVPGRRELRRALGPRGSLRRAFARLPVALRLGTTVFMHTLPALPWARLGVDGLNDAAREAWIDPPRFWRQLPKQHLFRASDGPLWNRELVLSSNRRVRRDVAGVLAALGAERAVIGHTSTEAFPGGAPHRIALAHDGLVVGIDVAPGSHHRAPGVALLLQGSAGWEISPVGRRRLW